MLYFGKHICGKRVKRAFVFNKSFPCVRGEKVEQGFYYFRLKGNIVRANCGFRRIFYNAMNVVGIRHEQHSRLNHIRSVRAYDRKGKEIQSRYTRQEKEISVNPFGIVTVNCGKEITLDNNKIL